MKILTIIISYCILSFSVLAQKQLKPWMGVHIEKAKSGVLIKKAVTGTPAFNAGLTEGDIIQSVNGETVSTPTELINIIQSKGVGHKVTVQYTNSKKENLSTTLSLEAMPGMLDLAKKNLLNKEAPNFEAKILSKNSKQIFNLKKEEGKVKLIEFWATWCGACMQAHPTVKQFAKANKEKVQVISISEEEPRIIKKFLHHARKKKMISDEVLFLQGADTEISKNYFVPALPMFFVLDKKNTVRFITIGTGDNLEQAFKESLKLAQ